MEICPDMICITQLLCKRINKTGGSALLIDYGHEGEKGDTFRVSQSLCIFHLTSFSIISCNLL